MWLEAWIIQFISLLSEIKFSLQFKEESFLIELELRVDNKDNSSEQHDPAIKSGKIRKCNFVKFC